MGWGPLFFGGLRRLYKHDKHRRITLGIKMVHFFSLKPEAGQGGAINLRVKFTNPCNTMFSLQNAGCTLLQYHRPADDTESTSHDAGQCFSL